MSDCGIDFIWLDQGRDLNSSQQHGPWTEDLKGNVSTFPVIQHHPKMTVRNTYQGSADQSDITNSQPRVPLPPSTTNFSQGEFMLPLEYESVLALVDLRKRCGYEPSYALIPIFVHAAFSETHFLNLMDAQISKEIDALAPEIRSGSISNLQFLLGILERHSYQLENCVRAIDLLFDLSAASGIKSSMTRSMSRIARGSSASLGSLPDDKEKPNETEGSSSTTQSSGTFSPKGLIDDYSHLLHRTGKLFERCKNGIEITMNKSMVLESRKAIEQAERVRKLTLLATVFIPLTFSTSVFGMNLKVLGQGEVDFWWFIVFSIPIVCLAYVFWVWDLGKLRGFLRRLFGSREKNARG